MAVFALQLANALVLCGQGLADTALPQLLSLKLHEPAPDGGGSQAHVFADLPNAQALNFDHLDDLQFEAGVKDSSGFGIVHVSCRFSFDNLSLCLFKLDHHKTYQQSRPKGSVRTRLEAQLAEAQLRLKNAQEAATSLLKQLEKNGAGTGGEIARGYADLLGATGTAQGQISKLETELEGLTDAQLVQFPTLPQKPSQPKKGLIAIGATLAAGLALLLFVFMRQALRNTAGNEKSSAKLLRIRKSLGLR